MVPEEGARFGYGHFQFGHERGRAAHPTGSAVDHSSLGLAMGLYCHRSDGICVDGVVALDLSRARGTSTPGIIRVGVYSQRPDRANNTDCMGAIVPASADVGFRHWQVHDRPYLVALPFLGPGFSQS